LKKPNKEGARLHEHWMQLALDQAEIAYQKHEVPIGAIVVYQNQVIGAGYNRRELDHDVTAHAEVIAIKQASQFLKSWRLNNCSLYVTVEPCLMCTGAIIQSRISEVIYGTDEPKSGAIRSTLSIEKIPHGKTTPTIQSGVLKDQCQEILVRFFKKKRHETL
jgi:tRNA(adenine34) deaminase